MDKSIESCPDCKFIFQWHSIAKVYFCHKHLPHKDTEVCLSIAVQQNIFCKLFRQEKLDILPMIPTTKNKLDKHKPTFYKTNLCDWMDANDLTWNNAKLQLILNNRIYKRREWSSIVLDHPDSG